MLASLTTAPPAPRFVAARSLRTLGTFAFILLGLALPLPVSARTWEEPPAAAWTEPARPDSGGGDAIVLLDQGDFHDSPSGTYFEYFGRSRVFTAEGRTAGTIEIEYEAGSVRLSEVRARSVQTNGQVTEWDPSHLIQTMALRVGPYRFMKATVVIPGVEPGCIVEWGYRLESVHKDLHSWRFRFANSVYTCNSVQTWWPSSDVPATVRRNWAYRRIGRADVVETLEPNAQAPYRIRFTTHHLAGVKDEALAPPGDDADPQVIVFYGDGGTPDYWKDWREAFDMFEAILAKDVGSLADSVEIIRKRYPDAESALPECFRWVQRRFHSLREPAWSPAGDDDANQEDDDEAPQSIADLIGHAELTPLAINSVMLESAKLLGLRATLGFVGDRRVGAFESDLAVLPPFNFVTVVELEGGSVFLQPDSRFSVYGSVPWYYRGGNCLVTGYGVRQFRRISPDSGAFAREHWKLSLDLTSDASLHGVVEAQLQGESGAHWKRSLWEQDPELWPRALSRLFAQSGGPDVAFERPDVSAPPDSGLRLRANGRWPAVPMNADRIGLPMANLIPWRTAPALQSGRRVQPVLLRDRRDETFDIEVRLPAGTTQVDLPDAQSYRNEIGSWEWQWSRADGVVRATRHVRIEKAEIPTTQFAAAREFFMRLARADAALALVRRTR